MKLTILLVFLVTCTLHVSGLFEDQAGRFDWKQKYVGEASYVGYYADRKISMLIAAIDHMSATAAMSTV